MDLTLLSPVEEALLSADATVVGAMSRRGPFDMDPCWVRRHNRNICTDSRTLPQAAFPSLPLDHSPLASADNGTRTSSQSTNITGLNDDEFDGSGIEDTITGLNDQDTVDAAETVDGNRHEPSLWTERKFDSINSSISRAVRYYFDELRPENRDVEDEARAEHKLLCDAGLLPEVRDSRRIRPRSVNMVQLRETNRGLRKKKETLIRELCKLGYESSDIEACILWKTAEILPEKPGHIDAYCLSNYNLKWLNTRLKLLVDNRRAIVDAREKFLAEAGSPTESPIVEPRKQQSRQPIPEVIDPPKLLERSDKLPPGSRRANPYPYTRVTAKLIHRDPYYSFRSIFHNEDQTHNEILPLQAGSLILQHYPPPLRGTFSDVGCESHSAAEYNQNQALERAANSLSQP